MSGKQHRTKVVIVTRDFSRQILIAAPKINSTHPFAKPIQS